MIRARYIIGIAALLTANAAQAQRRSSQLNLSAAVGVNVPISDLDRAAQAGLGIAVRTESGGSGMPWTLRGGLTFDRFGGKSGNGVDNYQYLTFVSELVHHTNARAYQFGGVGFYQSKTVSSPAQGCSNCIGNGSEARSESDFGFQVGVGLNFGTVTKTFLEIGVVDVLTTGRSSVWFPIRYGIRL